MKCCERDFDADGNCDIHEGQCEICQRPKFRLAQLCDECWELEKRVKTAGPIILKAIGERNGYSIEKLGLFTVTYVDDTGEHSFTTVSGTEAAKWSAKAMEPGSKILRVTVALGL